MKLNNKKATVGLLLCALVGLIIVLTGFFTAEKNSALLSDDNLTDYNENWTVTVGDYVFEDIETPASIEEAELGDTLILTNTLPDTIENDEYIFFRASYQRIKIFINNEEVYSFGWTESEGYTIGQSPGCAWIVVPVTKDQEGQEIRIELTGEYEGYEGLINSFSLGDKMSIIESIVLSKIGSAMISFALMVVGICMAVIGVVIRRGRSTKALFRLGIFSFIVGAWSMCALNFLQVINGDVLTMHFIEFFFFLLIIPTAIWFLDSLEYYSGRKILHIMFWCSIGLTFIIHLLQLLNIADYMQTLHLTQALLVITLLYLLIDGVKVIINKNAVREVKILISSVLVVIVFALIDMMKIYTYVTTDDGTFARIGMLMFIIIWAISIARNMSKTLVKMTQTELLEKLAYLDQMTGLKNRTAFEKHLMEIRENNTEYTFVIIFDMNDLKWINDNLGHTMGDVAIKGTGELIKNEFSKIGIAYRIGGDEFCVIITNDPQITNEDINVRIGNVKKELEKFGKEYDLKISVACGFEKTSIGNIDIDIAYRHADKQMYKDKNKIKLENSNEL